MTTSQRIAFTTVVFAFGMALIGFATVQTSRTQSEAPQPAVVAPPTTATPATTAEPGGASPPEAEAQPFGSTVAAPIANGDVAVFAAPGDAMPTWELANPRESGAPLVFLVAQDRGDWLEVHLPIRPNFTTGFIPRDAVSLSGHDWSIEVNLSGYRIRVLDGNDVFLDTDVAVAAQATPTPPGLYYMTELLEPPNPGGPYGPFAYGLSGFSNIHLPGGQFGEGQLGLHGTDQPSLMGREVSNGCVRLRNEDITRLAEVLPLGVPVTISA